MTDGHDDSPLHVPNLGERGVRRRMASGFVWSIVTLAAISYLSITHKPAPWFAVTGLSAALAAAGFLQARERTCVVLAVMDKRDHDAPVERWDANAKACARQQARGVAEGALLVAMLVGGLAVLLASRR
ncbi:MAG: hypothetical protein JWO05_2685 [Gemmatimonadetes bacterium]|nr:hypothetical protein [Gemmatimonadota bacterium]